MFRPDCARAHPGIEDRADCIGREGQGEDHDSKKEDELFSSLKADDIGIADRAYNHFKALPDSGGIASGMPYLPGFEKMFLKSVG